MVAETVVKTELADDSPEEGEDCEEEANDEEEGVVAGLNDATKVCNVVDNAGIPESVMDVWKRVTASAKLFGCTAFCS